MSALRQIRLQGGPDARAMQVIDMDTGLPLEGVVKVELLCVPNDGALVNVTLACRLDSIDLVARDAAQPLIDLPDEHPEAQGASVTRVEPSAGPVADMVREAFTPAGELPLAAPITPAVPVVVLPPVEPRRRRTQAEMVDPLRKPPADPAPAPLPDSPSPSARRAPPPEPAEEAEAQPEPDLSDAEKEELRARLAKQVPWPFPSSEERRTQAGRAA